MRVDPQEKLRRALTKEPGLRDDLLRVLEASSATRADVIRQLYERPDRLTWAELLMDLEADDSLRATLTMLLMRLDLEESSREG